MIWIWMAAVGLLIGGCAAASRSVVIRNLGVAPIRCTLLPEGETLIVVSCRCDGD
jgi:hypothetical protein